MNKKNLSNESLPKIAGGEIITKNGVKYITEERDINVLCDAARRANNPLSSERIQVLYNDLYGNGEAKLTAWEAGII